MIAAASAGPAFIVALQESVARDRRAGVAVAVGVALGSFRWALLFSTGRVRRAYTGAKLWIDRLAGGCLAVLGLKLALSER